MKRVETAKLSELKMTCVTGPLSSWESCRAIGSNLRKSYEMAFPQQVSFYQDPGGEDPQKTWELAQLLFHKKPQRLVFLDHAPHPFHLLSALDLLYGQEQRPEIFIHVYGDFLLHGPQWKSAETTLKKFPVSFVAASKRHARLLSALFKTPCDLRHCPFPVDETLFTPDFERRRKFRAQLKIKDDDFVMVYAGRISLQKNVDKLIQKFSELKSQTQLPFKLILAGSYDDFGSPLFERQEPLGSSFQHIRTIVESLPIETRKDLFFLGSLSPKKLAELHNASDTFVSLSLHHDEDFGLGPAEALCCGSPALLTSWGGYADFECSLIPVSFAPLKGHVVDWSVFRRILLSSALAFKSFEDRQRLAKNHQRHLSIPAVAERLRNLHSKPDEIFLGFSPFFEEVAQRMSQTIPFPEGPQSRSLYGKIYSAYLD